MGLPWLKIDVSHNSRVLNCIYYYTMYRYIGAIFFLKPPLVKYNSDINGGKYMKEICIDGHKNNNPDGAGGGFLCVEWSMHNNRE